MAKNVISQSDELARLRRSLIRRDIIESAFVSLGFVLLWLLYAVLAGLARGYGSLAPLASAAWLSFLPYPSMQSGLFDFSSSASVSRVIIMASAIVAAIGLGLLYFFLHYRRLDRKYVSSFTGLLIEEGKLNGLIIDRKKDSGPDSFLPVLEQLNIASPKYLFSMQFSTALISWEGRQYSYLRDGRPRDGFLISTDLSRARSHAFIQLRTFGEPSLKQYQGLPIKKYGFGDMPSLNSFVCFTSLGQDIYLAIDKRAADAISAFAAYVRCDIILMVIGDRLTIFLDGFRLRLPRKLKERLPSQILEQEAEALVALHQGITAISIAFSGDIAFAPEDKGNGIVSY